MATVTPTSTTGNDTVTLGSGGQVYDGGAGNDSISGGSGADTLDGGSGFDIVSGGAGADILIYKAFENQWKIGNTVFAGSEDGLAPVVGIGSSFTGLDQYDGGNGGGADTLQIWLSADQLANAAIMNDIKAAQAWVADHMRGASGQADGSVYKFTTLNLTITQLEKIEVRNFFGSLDIVNPAVVSVAINDPQITDADAGMTRTATITFSEAMNQTIAPVVTNNAGSTLTAPSGVWLDATHYRVTYTVADANVSLADVTFNVSGARDLAGNPQVAATSVSSGTSVDTQNATVVSAAISDPQITDADAGLTRTATITFSEAMNQTIAPVVTNNAGSTLTAPSGVWLDATHYRITYTVADANVSLADVTFNVSGAKDLSGNTQVAATSVSSGTSVDTQNATVVSVAINDPQVTDADAGMTRTATITFSEAMNQTIAPVVTNNAGSTLTAPAGVWLDATHYRVTYTVADANVSLANITFTVSGAKDLAGNTQVAANSVSSGTSIDTANPTVTDVTANDLLITDANAGTGTFSVAVTFSEAMDTGATPVLTFAPDVASTLTLSGGVWSLGNTVYTATYDVADANLVANGVTIDVSGAQDAGGNAQQDYTAAAEFSIDTANPTVTDVTANDLLITDANAGTGTFSVAVTFSEAMDTGATPVLTFAPDVASTLTLSGGVWSLGNTVYTATYDVADANLVANGVTIDVSGAQDAGGNAQQDYTAAAEFSIDTANPTVTDVTANDLLITDANAGTGTFSVAVTFSEAMDTGATPVLTFAPDVASTLTLSGGVWSLGNTVYTATYDVADANLVANGVTIDVSGAQDAGGNAQQDYTAAAEFSIDTANPTVTDVTANDLLITDANAGTGTFSVAVTFSEAMDTGATPVLTFAPDVASTLTLSGGVWSLGNTVYTATYDVADANLVANGVTIDVSGAQDAGGNAQQDYTAAAEFSIDTANPTVTDVTANDLLITDANAGTGTFSVAVTFSEAMDTGATPVLTFAPDVASTLTLSGGVWSLGNTVYTATYDVADANLVANGVTIDVSGAQDAGGNAQQDYTAAAEFSIDTANPTVTDVTANDLLITDANAGTGTFSVAVTFSEAMDTGATPVLTFAPDVASTLTLSGGVWSLGNTVYTATYDVADANLVANGVTIDVSGAQDAGGNAQQDYTAAAEFSIDTANPTVTDVTANDLLITDANAGTGTFSVAVTFSEAMDTGATPVLTFAPDVASTLTLSGGVWSLGNTVYTATYDVADANLVANGVTIDVSGAQDAGGNAQQDYTAAAEFSIDTANPTVTDVTANDLLITDANAGTGTFSVAVTFSEAMDTGATPVLTFAPDVASTLTLSGGVWSLGNTVYTATYDVADANLVANGVTIDVSGAQDAGGNAQQDYTAAAEFSIDTANPTVTDVTANDLLITDANAGTGTFSVAVTFSEAMDTGATPVLTFAPDVASTLTLSGGVWSLGNTVYTATYDVADANLVANGVTIDVSGAQDAGGNAQQDYTAAAEFSIDTANPTVTSVIYPVGDGTLKAGETVILTVNFNEAVTVAGGTPTLTLDSVGTATFTGGSGTSALTFSYTVDAGQNSSDLAVLAFNLAGATVRDAAGNDANTAGAATNPAGTLVIDTLAPTAGTLSFSNLADTGTGNSPPVTTDNAFNLTLTGNADANGTSVTYERSFNGDPFASTAASQSALADGTYAYRAIVTDPAGNSSTSNTITVVIDNTAPMVGTLSFSNLADTGTANSPPVTTDNAFDLTLAGNADANGTTVTYERSLNGGGFVSTGASQSGLADGTYAYRAIVTDPAGNSSTSNTITVVIDNTAPSTPTALDLAAVDDTGSSSTDNITKNTAALTISGSASENGASVTVFDDLDNDGAIDAGESLGTATVSGGAFSLDVSLTASATPHNVRAIQTDLAGNVSVASASHGFDITVDTTAPRISSIDRQTPAGSPTNANALTFRVTFAEAVANIDSADFTVSGTTATVTSVVSAGGNAYDVTLSGGNLASLNGTVTLGFAGGQNITDIAGNALTNTTPTGTNNNNYALDNTAPSAPTGLDLATLDDTGSSSTDNITSNVSGLTISGSGENGASVTVFDDLDNDGAVDAGESLGTATVSGGTFSLDVSLAASATPHNVRAIQTDVAGNASTASAGLSVTVDTTVPTVSSISGTSSRSGNTGTATFTVTFTESVFNVTADDFVLFGNSTTGAPFPSITAVSPVGGAATVWTITVDYDGRLPSNGDRGNTLGLNLKSGTNVQDAAGNIASGSSFATAQIASLAPAGVAGSPINLGLSSADTDGQPVTVTIANAPADWTFDGGVQYPDGTWTITTADPTSLTVTAPVTYAGAEVLDVTMTWIDAQGVQHTVAIADNVEAYAPGNPIFALSGDDNLTGSVEADIFVIAQPIGTDRFFSFDPALDKVDLVAFTGFANFADVAEHLADDAAGNAVLDLGNGQTIIFEGVSADALSAENFVFDEVPTVTNTASIVIGDGAMLSLSGMIENSGTIALQSAGGGARLELIQHGMTLQGGGQVVLSDDVRNVIAGTLESVTLNNVDNTISGAGQIGVLTLSNAGGIVADGTNALVIDTGANVIVNSGTLSATGAGGLVIASSIDNSGVVAVSGSSLILDGSLTGAGELVLDGRAAASLSGAVANAITLAADAAVELGFGNAASVTGIINGFDGNDEIDLVNLAFGEDSSVEYQANADGTGGVLHVISGTQAVDLTLSGTYDAALFHAAADSDGSILLLYGNSANFA